MCTFKNASNFKEERFDMNNNRILIAATIGALSTLPAEIVTRVLLFLGMGKYSLYDLCSFTITVNRPITIIGLIIVFLGGSLVGVLLYLSIEKWGSDYLFIKGIMAGLFFWVAWEFMFTAFIEGIFIAIRPINDYYVHIIGTTIFGAIMGLFFKIFLFKKSSSQSN